MTKMNRRTLLKYAGTSLVAGAFAGSIGKTMASGYPKRQKNQPGVASPGKFPFH